MTSLRYRALLGNTWRIPPQNQKNTHENPKEYFQTQRVLQKTHKSFQTHKSFPKKNLFAIIFAYIFSYPLKNPKKNVS